MTNEFGESTLNKWANEVKDKITKTKQLYVCIRTSYKFSFFFGICAFSYSGLGQDTTQTSFQRFCEEQQKTGAYIINDINQENYKISIWNDSTEEYVKIENQKIKLDTSIYVDNWTPNQTKNLDLINNYYFEHINSPPHSGDPNYAIVSFIINGNGELVSIRILEDVKNRMCGGEWEITLLKNYGFEPLVKDNEPCIVEYIVKITDIGYCVPIIEKSEAINN